VRLEVEEYFSSLENIDLGLNIPPPMLIICQEGLFSAREVALMPASGTPEIEIVTALRLSLLCRSRLTGDACGISEAVCFASLILSRDSPVRCLFLARPIAPTAEH